ncbi:hypothetical protein C8R41DRAFT_869919 [Lentinula lateritia]|uniref:Uncharacterized protein n=1 Tax=Lentinula lateritia TaxID=40482 RepID=A0ABQ8V8L1_9AGAR|nr:hypothetical protein C8R41DRAFT_869919 [Lentinula lateritia]
MDSPTDKSRKRGQCNQGSSNRGNRCQHTAPSATSNENSMAIPETESHINPTATAEVCGIGPILAHTQRPLSPSKNPALNSRIFRAMAKKTGQGSGQVASDVWYNVCPYSKLISGIGKWHAWKNTNGQSDGIRDHLQKEHWDLYCETVLKEKLKGFEKISTHP